MEHSFPVPIAAADAEEMSERFSWHPGKLTFRPLQGSSKIKTFSHFSGTDNIIYCENFASSDIAMDLGCDPGLVNIFVPLQGFFETTLGKDVIVSSERLGTIESGVGVKQYVIRAGRHQRVLVIKRDYLIQQLFAHIGKPIIGALHFHPEFDIGEKPGSLINALALAFHQGCVQSDIISRSPLIATNLTEAVTEVVLAFMPHSFSHLYHVAASIGASWQTRRAMDYIVANASKPLSVKDIAEACQVSVRSLYATFRQQLDTTPKLYLRNVRLAGARREILDPNSTDAIASIARRWGFMNLSLFAKQYRASFGELPLRSRLKTRTAGR